MDDSSDEKADKAVVAAAKVFAEAVQEKDWPLALFATYKLTELLEIVSDQLVPQIALMYHGDTDAVARESMARMPDWLDRLEAHIDELAP